MFSTLKNNRIKCTFEPPNFAKVAILAPQQKNSNFGPLTLQNTEEKKVAILSLYL